MTVIVVDPGGSDHWPAKITSDVVDDSFRIAFIRLCINIKPMFVFCVAKRLNVFEGRTEFVFQSVEKGGAEGISQKGIVKVFYMTPDTVITEPALRDETMNMWVPF